MGEIFNLDDMIKKEMKGFKKDENSSAKPSEYLREYADTLQELAEIIRSYLDIADEYLQDMIGQTKLDYRDFCIEEDDIEVFLESITDSNLAPISLPLKTSFPFNPYNCSITKSSFSDRIFLSRMDTLFFISLLQT